MSDKQLSPQSIQFVSLSNHTQFPLSPRNKHNLQKIFVSAAHLRKCFPKINFQLVRYFDVRMLIRHSNLENSNDTKITMKQAAYSGSSARFDRFRRFFVWKLPNVTNLHANSNVVQMCCSTIENAVRRNENVPLNSYPVPQKADRAAKSE